MNVLKKFVCKRAIILFFCTFLLFLNFFMSYDLTVHASSVSDDLDEKYERIIRDAMITAASACGVVLTGGGATAILPIVLSGALSQTDNLKDYVDAYINSNNNGTTTISADFVNLVLQAYQEYTKQIFDGTIDYDDQTMRYIYGSSSYKLTGRNGSSYASQISGFESYYPVAFLLVAGTTEYKYLNWGGSSFNPESTNTGFGGSLFYYNLNPDSNWDGIQTVQRYPDTLAVKPTTIMYTNGVARNPMEGFYVQNISGPNASEPYFILFDSGTIPVYTSFDMMRNAFHSGDYTSAENYTVGGSSAGQTSSYTGEYTGGDITVETEKLNDISDKLAELEASNSNIEEILMELLEWLKLNGGGESSGSGGGNVTVNVDMTQTNSWLAKIYAKVSQIYDRISETVEDTGQVALDGIESKLDEISETLKKIKGWTIADTVADAADAVADWLDFIKDMLSDVDSGVSAISSSMSDVANLMKSKFPFCLPWDVAALITFLAHEPETPVFQLPIIIENFGIEEYIEVDMTRFSVLSTLSRTLLTLIYCYGLVNLTFKVIPMVKEED